MSLTSGLLLALLLLVVLGASLGGRLSPSLPHSTLLRSLFPSWRFFEANEPSLCLFARVVQGEGERELAPFAPLLPEQRRGLPALLFNPRGNLLLACHGLLDRLVSELAELGPTPIEEAERLVSYQLLQNLARCFLPREAGAADLRYQLKLVSSGPGQGESEELLLSPLYPLS